MLLELLVLRLKSRPLLVRFNYRVSSLRELPRVLKFMCNNYKTVRTANNHGRSVHMKRLAPDVNVSNYTLHVKSIKPIGFTIRKNAFLNSWRVIMSKPYRGYLTNNYWQVTWQSRLQSNEMTSQQLKINIQIFKIFKFFYTSLYAIKGSKKRA